jgi:hypothetical protein
MGRSGDERGGRGAGLQDGATIDQRHEASFRSGDAETGGV